MKILPEVYFLTDQIVHGILEQMIQIDWLIY